MSPSGLLGSLVYKKDGEALQVCPVHAHTLRCAQTLLLGLGRSLPLIKMPCPGVLPSRREMRPNSCSWGLSSPQLQRAEEDEDSGICSLGCPRTGCYPASVWGCRCKATTTKWDAFFPSFLRGSMARTQVLLLTCFPFRLELALPPRRWLTSQPHSLTHCRESPLGSPLPTKPLSNSFPP